MIKERSKAPDFTLPDDTGTLQTLAQFRGKWVVIYFYPKDDTPGCTKEACDFRDNLPNLAKKNCVVLGISKDNEKSHTKFKEKYDLNFILLSDADLAVHKSYHALEEGKTIRSTFLIDGQGNIVKIWPKVKVDGHVSAILKVLEESSNG